MPPFHSVWRCRVAKPPICVILTTIHFKAQRITYKNYIFQSPSCIHAQPSLRYLAFGSSSSQRTIFLDMNNLDKDTFFNVQAVSMHSLAFVIRRSAAAAVRGLSSSMLAVSRVPELWTCEERSCIMHTFRAAAAEAALREGKNMMNHSSFSFFFSKGSPRGNGRVRGLGCLFAWSRVQAVWTCEERSCIMHREKTWWATPTSKSVKQSLSRNQ